ncbi:MAG: hypothetical protein M1813_005441 [Trichoglossum hirsutum]|nr:MAG: hypothetical protein M1813_005441 [Trichoglossum hirsutum]
MAIIDWGFATTLPLQFAIYFPRIDLAEEVMKFLAGSVGQKSNQTREKILDAIKIEDDELRG